MMQLLQESEAIEELGIGKVRDHFSNTLFPGTSTLQHHAKYLAILPSLYYQVANCGKKFATIREVERHIIEAEIQLTRQLAEHESLSPKTGITGINTYEEALTNYKKYVKYNPTYIYGSGLATYKMIPNTSIYQLILDTSKNNTEKPQSRYRRQNLEDLTEDDLNEMTGKKQQIVCSGVTYDFSSRGKSISLAMTPTEAEFVKAKITQSCQGTLLTFLLEKKDIVLTKELGYYDLGQQLCGLDENIRDIYDKSVLFSKLIHLIDYSFNHAYYASFNHQEMADSCYQAYVELYEEHRKTLADTIGYRSLFNYIREKDPLLAIFCEKCYKSLIQNGAGTLDELDKFVTCREKTVKRERSKIGNSSYRDVKRPKLTYNTFRWETVRTMVNEIRNPQ